MSKAKALKLFPEFSLEDLQKAIHNLSDEEFNELADAFGLEEVEPDEYTDKNPPR
ncbi:hypothetical protein [Lacticaseibacillus casei]|uniref:hypothetical protein n=1 Tax=Lacticaseibacillus casei TaxID=1582 RepID=UPI0014866A6A|nr:hypothetical protein [Lacticaseibacillus casei]